MKLTPTNQTLILASEQRDTVSAGNLFGKSVASTGSVLQRVTIVASKPDTTLLYLRADYSVEDADSGGPAIYGGRARAGYADQSGDTPADPRSLQSSSLRLASQTAPQSAALVAQHLPSTVARDAYGNALASRRDAKISSYLRPAEQYAQTQRLLTETPPVQRLDLHA